MGTPADQALAGGKGGAAPPGGGAANGGAAPPPNGGAQPFFSGWDKPEQIEVRDWAKNKNFADVFTLAKTAQGLEKEAATIRGGNKGYPVPGQDGKVDANAVGAWRSLTGVPETADKYDLSPAFPENYPYPQLKGYLAEELHKVHVPAAMAPALAKGYENALGRLESELKAQEDAQSKEGLALIEREWGSKYQENMGIANAGKAFLAKQAGGLSDIQLRTLESVLGTPKWMKLLHTFGAGMQEHGFAGDGGTPSGFQGGASEAQARIDQLTADRTAGKISEQQWREITKNGGEYDQLMARVVAGFAPQA